MPLDPEWKRVAIDRPDARMRQSVAEKRHKLLGWMEQVFCVNCGKEGGMISRDWARHVFYLCDECAITHGTLPVPEVPEGFLKGPENPTKVMVL
jgi:hypothetical protein